MLKSCLNVKINYVWVGAPHTGTAISFKLLNSGYASAIDFKITKRLFKPPRRALTAASVFTEAACVNLTDQICSSIQDSANQLHQFSIFFSIYGHCGQIPELVGSYLQTNARARVRKQKKTFCTQRSLCNRQQRDQRNESSNYCLQSNSLASERKQRIECAAACRVSWVLR